MTHPAVPAVTPTDEPAPMRDRVPAQALIEQVLLHRAGAHRRSRLQRMIGVDPLDEEARAWYLGATGERQVAARLTGLPLGWTVLHSLPAGRNGADIDHLVVGPGGVFTINTKHHHDASVWVAGRTVLVAGHRQPYVAKSEAEALRVERIVADVLPEAPAVRPVVAVVGAKRLTVRAAPARVMVMQAEHLRRWLVRQPVRLTAAQVAVLAARFDDPATWQPAAEAGPELLIAFGGVVREVRGASRTRVGWALGVVALTTGAAAATVLPGLAAVLGH